MMPSGKKVISGPGLASSGTLQEECCPLWGLSAASSGQLSVRRKARARPGLTRLVKRASGDRLSKTGATMALTVRRHVACSRRESLAARAGRTGDPGSVGLSGDAEVDRHRGSARP
jgi:hypothetical protein